MSLVDRSSKLSFEKSSGAKQLCRSDSHLQLNCLQGLVLEGQPIVCGMFVSLPEGLVFETKLCLCGGMW